VAHAARILTPRDLTPVQRVDAVVPGDALQLELAEELDRLAPFGMGNPEPALLVPSALLGDPRPMGEGRHVSFTLAAGGARSRCVAFGRGSSLPAAPGEPVDAAVRLEVNRYNGAVEPRLVLRHAQPARPAPIEIAGEPPFGDAVRAELARALTACPPATAAAPPADDLRGMADGLGRPPGRTVRDARGGGIAGLLGDLVAAGAPVLAVTAHAQHRAAALRDRVGGFTVTTWAALESDPGMAAAFTHVVAVDPPAHAHLDALAGALPGDGWTHLAWGDAELEVARRVLAWNFDLRPQLAELYRGLREAVAAPADGSPLSGAPLEAVLRGSAPQPRSGALAGRLLRVLAELELVTLDAAELAIAVPPPRARTELERSPAFRAYAERLRDGLAYLAEPSRTGEPAAAPHAAEAVAAVAIA
jgi:single-stranded-DNA-specific exonuclease